MISSSHHSTSVYLGIAGDGEGAFNWKAKNTIFNFFFNYNFICENFWRLFCFIFFVINLFFEIFFLIMANVEALNKIFINNIYSI